MDRQNNLDEMLKLVGQISTETVYDSEQRWEGTQRLIKLIESNMKVNCCRELQDKLIEAEQALLDIQALAIMEEPHHKIYDIIYKYKFSNEDMVRLLEKLEARRHQHEKKPEVS